MKIGKSYLRDKYGYPVETYSGFYPITNFLRLVIHTNIAKTIQYWGNPHTNTQAACDCCQAKEMP